MSNNIRRIILYLILVLEISSLFLCIPSVQNFILHIGGMLVGKVSLPRSTWGIRIISFALFIQCALISIVLWSRNTKLNRYGLIIGLLCAQIAKSPEISIANIVFLCSFVIHVLPEELITYYRQIDMGISKKRAALNSFLADVIVVPLVIIGSIIG